MKANRKEKSLLGIEQSFLAFVRLMQEAVTRSCMVTKWPRCGRQLGGGGEAPS